MIGGDGDEEDEFQRLLDALGDDTSDVVEEQPTLETEPEPTPEPEPEPTPEPVIEQLKPSGRLKRKPRKNLVRRDRKKLSQLSAKDVDKFSEFTTLRYSILNDYFTNKSSRSKKVSADQLRDFLRNKASQPGFKFNIPKKYRNRSVNAMLGDIPFKNLLLWCNKCTDFKSAALHLCMAVPSSEQDDPQDPLIHLIGAKCKEGNCRGKYGVWIFDDPIGH